MRYVTMILAAVLAMNTAFAADSYADLERKEKERLEKSRRDQAKRDRDGKRIRAEAQNNRRDLGKSQSQLKKEGKIAGNSSPGRMLDVKN